MLLLAACSEKPAQTPAAAAPSATVATPVKRTVTDWDEFTGRFEAVEQVDVRARVGGFVTRVGFSDGELVRKDDLLYLIDSRPYDAAAAQVDGQLADARARVELGKRELDRSLELSKSQNVADARRPEAPGAAGGQAPCLIASRAETCATGH